MQLRQGFLRLTLAATLAGILTACGPVREETTPTDPDIARAAQLLQAQDYLGASALYRQLATRSSGSEAVAYLFSAAEASLKGNDFATAQAITGQLAQAALDPQQAFRLMLLQAELAMAQNRFDQALRDLTANPPAAQINPLLQQRYLRDLADAYRLNGNLLEAANSLQKLDSMLLDPAQRLEVQSEILRSLAMLNELVLNNLQPSPPGISGGWMQLALLVKKYGDDPEAMQQQLAIWRTENPDHPALPELLSDYQARLQATITRAAHIAVLLPQSGPYAGAADALRDGIMASLFALPADKRPQLRFYDSSDTNELWPLYSQAVAEGAEMIIGPLQKDAVVQLARAGELPVPVLALNQVQTDSIPPLNLFMFSLSPEDEARQAAERIWLDGLRRPVLFVPDGDWGSRIANAFNQRWQSLSGEGIEHRGYDDQSSDYSAAITTLLHLDRSEARHQQVQRWLGERVEFEPRRREDIDAIFIAARPRQAQSFPPQLAFHRAMDLPLYATSHAWTGELSEQQLADMRGMMLADIPLMVADEERAQLASALPAIAGPLVRLYAMGMDAMTLVPHLNRLQSSTFESLDGHTGNLFMDPENRVLRQTVWLRLGKPPRILGYAARLDLQQPLQQLAPEQQPLSPADQGAPVSGSAPPPGNS